MNIQILGAMLRQGTGNRNFPYVIEILQISLDENIKPNDVFLKHLHNFYDRCARSIDERVNFIIIICNIKIHFNSKYFLASFNKIEVI